MTQWHPYRQATTQQMVFETVQREEVLAGIIAVEYFGNAISEQHAELGESWRTDVAIEVVQAMSRTKILGFYQR